jgi:hypothetical protein
MKCLYILKVRKFFFVKTIPLECYIIINNKSFIIQKIEWLNIFTTKIFSKFCPELFYLFVLYTESYYFIF